MPSWADADVSGTQQLFTVIEVGDELRIRVIDEAFEGQHTHWVPSDSGKDMGVPCYGSSMAMCMCFPDGVDIRRLDSGQLKAILDTYGVNPPDGDPSAWSEQVWQAVYRSCGISLCSNLVLPNGTTIHSADTRDQFMTHIWNFNTNRLEVLQGGRQVFGAVADLAKDNKWGDPRSYDIVLACKPAAGRYKRTYVVSGVTTADPQTNIPRPHKYDLPDPVKEQIRAEYVEIGDILSPRKIEWVVEKTGVALRNARLSGSVQLVLVGNGGLAVPPANRTPAPTATQPAPTATQPAPTATQPAPTATQPAPTASQPEGRRRRDPFAKQP